MKRRAKIILLEWLSNATLISFTFKITPDKEVLCICYDGLRKNIKAYYERKILAVEEKEIWKFRELLYLKKRIGFIYIYIYRNTFL